MLHGVEGDTLKVTSTTQKLEKKLKKCYREKNALLVETRGNVYASSLTLEEVVQKRIIKGDDMKIKVRDTTLLLREEVFGRKDSFYLLIRK